MYYQNTCSDKWNARMARKNRKAERVRKWANNMKENMHGTSIPVNIVETDDEYELSLFAAGLEKSDFKISVANRILTIKVEPKEIDLEGNAKWKIREYRPGGFTRQFDLNKKIDMDAIKAEYTNGVLVLKLAKLEDHQTTRQDIPIA